MPRSPLYYLFRVINLAKKIQPEIQKAKKTGKAPNTRRLLKRIETFELREILLLKQLTGSEKLAEEAGIIYNLTKEALKDIKEKKFDKAEEIVKRIIQLEGAVFEQLKVLEKNIKENQGEIGDLHQREIEFQNNLADIRSKMGFRERLLGGFFGGNKTLVEEAKTIKEDLALFEENIKKLNQGQKINEDQIINIIKLYSEQHDPNFKQLKEYLARITGLRKEAYNLIVSIENAVSEFKHAEFQEMMNIPGRRQSPFSVLSKFDAQGSLDEVKAEAKNFQKKLEKYNSYMKKNPSKRVLAAPKQSLRGLDALANIVFDQNIFITLLTWKDIYSAIKELQSFLRDVKELKKKIDQEYKKALNNYQRYVTNTRKALAA